MFLGTLLSTLLTVAWREGCILYKHLFHCKVSEYFKCYFLWFAMALLVAFLLHLLFLGLPGGIFGLLAKLAISALAINGIFFVVMQKNENMRFLIDCVKGLIGRAVK